MPANLTINEPSADIEVSLDEMLNFGHVYEHFNDLLADKTAEAIGFDPDDQDAALTVRERVIVGIAGHTPNVVIFRVGYEIED